MIDVQTHLRLEIFICIIVKTCKCQCHWCAEKAKWKVHMHKKLHVSFFKLCLGYALAKSIFCSPLLLGNLMKLVVSLDLFSFNEHLAL